MGTTELMENTKETAISYISTVQELVASVKIGRIGIRLFDAYLSALETPVSLLSRSLKVNALLGLVGMQLVRMDEKSLSSSRPQKDDIAEIFDCIDEQEGSIQYLLNLLSQRGKAQGLGEAAEVLRLSELINGLLVT